jgi:hypothetical protein
MPSLEDVDLLLKLRLAADSPAKFAKVGAVWKEMRLGFYYLDDKVADIIAADVAVQCAALDGVKLSNDVLRLLQDDIGLNTLASDAISRIFVATSVPTSF